MRKLILLLSMSSLLLIPSCIKDQNRSDKSPVSGPQTVKSKTMTTGIPISQMHDEMIDEFITLYGRPASVNNRTELRAVALRICQISVNKGYLTFATAAEMTDDMMAHFDVIGIFDSGGNLKTQPAINAIAIGAEENEGVKAALTNIENYAGDPDGFISYANSQVQSLQSLTGRAAERADAFGEVLNGSGTKWQTFGALFDALTFKQKVIVLAKADAFGALVGELVAHEQHIIGPAKAVIIATYAATHSAVAAKL